MSSKKSDDGDPTNYLAQMSRRLDQALRDSGRTVTALEPLGTNKFQVTLPQGRRPKATSSRSKQGIGRRRKVSVTVEWGYEPHSLVLAAATWASIQAGESHTAESEGWYEGGSFVIRWSFNDSDLGDMAVSYGNDGADGFIGSWRDAIVNEI